MNLAIVHQSSYNQTAILLHFHAFLGVRVPDNVQTTEGFATSAKRLRLFILGYRCQCCRNLTGPTRL